MLGPRCTLVLYHFAPPEGVVSQCHLYLNGQIIESMFTLVPWKKQAPLEELWLAGKKYQKLSSRAHILKHVTKPTNKMSAVLKFLKYCLV